jgi:transcriptional/translational regulatory protein YebC/TACO1
MNTQPTVGDRVYIARVKFANHQHMIGREGTVKRVFKTKPTADIKLNDGSIWEATIENIEPMYRLIDTGAPRIEQTPAGAQTVIAETPARQVPKAPLRAKRPQNDSPLALELPAIDAQQFKLF